MAKVDTKTITPEDAEKLLAADSANRKVSRQRVEMYARDMAEGKWVFQGDAIRIREDGALIDGQHRLHAVVESGKAQQFVVVSDLPKEAMAVIDRNRSRSIGDYLAIEGYPNSHFVAAALTELYRWEQGAQGLSSGGQNRPTMAEALDILKRHPEVEEYVPQIQRMRYRLAMSIPMAAWTVFKMITDEIDREDSVWFHHHFSSGEELTSGHPVYALRRVVQHWHNQNVGSKSRDPRPYRAVMVKAWNAYRQGAEIHQLGYRQRETFPVIDGGETVDWIKEER